MYDDEERTLLLVADARLPVRITALRAWYENAKELTD